jgi:hypothetical protein
MSRPTDDAEALRGVLAGEAESEAGAGPESGDPEPEELLDYLAGRLPPEGEARVGRRLVASPAAARALLDLAGFVDAAAEAGSAPPKLAARAGWRDLRGRLGDAARRSRPLPPLAMGLAAALLAVAVGLGAWVWRLKATEHRPVGNLTSLELAAGLRSGEEQAVELPGGAPLRLVIEPSERCAVYEAVVEGPRPGERATIRDLARGKGGQLTVLFRRLRPGDYSLRLLGCEPRRELEQHRFRVARPAAAEAEGDGG